MVNTKNKGFKSYTDVNNYNNFLKELDANQMHKQTSKLEHISVNKNEIDKIIKTMDDEFLETEIKHEKFCIDTVEKYLDPNLYEGIKKDEPLVPVYKNKVNITADVNNINDLLNLIEIYPDDKETDYNINIHVLHKIQIPLEQLNGMIGMKSLKEDIVNQIIYYIQNLHKTTVKDKEKCNDYMHTVIYGHPGTGKTEIAKIIGTIFSKMGILKNETFKKVTRSDLIAGYLGQTALKTRDVIKECLGGVLFIDEAYALGNEEKQDSFSKECIDTLCEGLSDNKDNLMVIIAGYENELNKCFFNYNQGLSSRFTWRFKTDDYTGEDLYNIFLKMVNDCGWTITENSNINIQWFEHNKKNFKFYGRDIETLFAKTKITHSRRVFCLDSSIKTRLTVSDLDNGLALFLKNEDTKNKENDKYKQFISSMYV